MPWIQTYIGERLDLEAPRPEMIRPADISHALSNIARFNGHTRQFYSVAQHSIFVADLVDPAFRAHALLHDAAEAYIGDVVSPLKILLAPLIGEIEDRIEAVIAIRFGIEWTPEAHRAVKHADRVALATERRDLFLSRLVWDEVGDLPEPYHGKVIPVEPVVARAQFEAELAPLLPLFNHAK